MDTALLVSRLVLAAVFAAAALAKLADLEGSRGTMRAFGLPEGAARTAGTLLPFAELAVAGALLANSMASYAGLAALALLAAFVAAIARSIARGEHPDMPQK